MKSTLKQILDRQGILVLDGSMGTALETNCGRPASWPTGRNWLRKSTSSISGPAPMRALPAVTRPLCRALWKRGTAANRQKPSSPGQSRSFWTPARNGGTPKGSRPAGPGRSVWPVPAHTGLIWPMGPNIRAITASVPIRCGTSIAAGRNSCGRPVPTSCSLKRNRRRTGRPLLDQLFLLRRPPQLRRPAPGRLCPPAGP